MRVDFMPRRGSSPPRVMRIVEGCAADGVIITAGPDTFHVSTPFPLEVEDGTVGASFIAVEGARQRLTLTWHLSCEEAPVVA